MVLCVRVVGLKPGPDVLGAADTEGDVFWDH